MSILERANLPPAGLPYLRNGRKLTAPDEGGHNHPQARPGAGVRLLSSDRHRVQDLQHLACQDFGRKRLREVGRV